MLCYAVVLQRYMQEAMGIVVSSRHGVFSSTQCKILRDGLSAAPPEVPFPSPTPSVMNDNVIFM